MLGDAAPQYDATGIPRQRNGAVWYTSPLSVTAQAADGYVTVTPPFGRSPIDDTPVRLEKEETPCREWLSDWIGARTVSEALEEARAKGWAAIRVDSVTQAPVPRLARGSGYVRESWPGFGQSRI